MLIRDIVAKHRNNDRGDNTVVFNVSFQPSKGVCFDKSDMQKLIGELEHILQSGLGINSTGLYPFTALHINEYGNVLTKYSIKNAFDLNFLHGHVAGTKPTLQFEIRHENCTKAAELIAKFLKNKQALIEELNRQLHMSLRSDDSLGSYEVSHAPKSG